MKLYVDPEVRMKEIGNRLDEEARVFAVA